jgi:predicted phage baseplate assembly protein
VTVSGYAGAWEERIDFIGSEGDDEHFIVETDEEGRSLVRFGNGVNGAPLPPDAVVTCRYQVGQGSAGNVGADALTGFDAADLSGVTRAWNPLDVVNGRDPEPAAEVLRRAPEAYRARQLRAVTLEDYAQRAEELPGVANAAARYRWAGSWRTVQIAIDPTGTTALTSALRRQVADHLDAVRLIGEDLEILPAVYVPLDIKLRLCAHPRYWPEHLRLELEMEFSDGWTADGRRGFFHPDLWTFGQPLHASRIIGRALAVPGVDRVLSLSMRRWNPGPGGGLTTVVLAPEDLPDSVVERVDVGAFEIVRVENDPDRLERGRILFEILGGRR